MSINVLVPNQQMGVVAHESPAQLTHSVHAPVTTECPRCNGRGYHSGINPNVRGLVKSDCSRCSGSGVLEVPAEILRAVELRLTLWKLETELAAAKDNLLKVTAPCLWGGGDADTIKAADDLVFALWWSMEQPKADLKAITDQRSYSSWRLYVDSQTIIGIYNAKRATEEARKIAAYKTSVAKTREDAKTATPLMNGKATWEHLPQSAYEPVTDPNVLRHLAKTGVAK